MTILEALLGTLADGRWSSPRAGITLPRQNGKNVAVEVREMYGMLQLGERVLHSAHELKTANKSFRRLLEFFDSPRQFPRLHQQVKSIGRCRGSEAILLHNGGSFELVSRSRASGRGYSADLLVLDEAQELSADAHAALRFAISASSNPQEVLLGTPPGPNADGEIWTRTRNAGLLGEDPRLAWLEWGCVGGADLDDQMNWAAANPALGIRLDPDTVADERAAMDDESFGRERLGIWDSAAAHRVISEAAWARCADPNIPKTSGEIALAADVSPDRSTATIAAAGLTPAGIPFVDAGETRRGEPDWVVHKVVEVCTKNAVRAVVIDQMSAASSLIDPLRRADVTVTTTSSRQMAAACVLLYDSVAAERLRHLDQPQLNTALSVARRRVIGDGGWGWSRKNSDSDITAIVASTLALWGLASGEVAVPPRRRSGKATFV